MSILIINGPNLNTLGKREPSIYGNLTLEEINRNMVKYGEKICKKNIKFDFFQSNHEGAIVDKINQAECDVIIINAAAFTHTSISIRDAILSCKIPTIEVHISNIYKREEFRKHSMISEVCLGQISGFGSNGYILAVQASVNIAQSKSNS
ncbi:MAG: type II 3-dehydroquinate dehydratase [bacterium]|nr:type II 3-dehydroquinate dehydratase [bacterium]